jgi:DNA-binding transcriptional MerR regulator
MFSIHELSTQSGVSAQAIRYYERIHLLPPAQRAENGYRIYDEGDVQRLQFVRQARSLDFTLRDIAEILALRDHNQAPCNYVLVVMQQRIGEIEQRIQEMKRLKAGVKALYKIGRQLPEDIKMRTCVCHLIQTSGDS